MNENKLPKNPENIIPNLEKATATEAIDQILVSATDNLASDVHIDPYLDTILVRFRIDGILREVIRLPVNLLEETIARLKILCGVRTDIHFVPQDGRFRSNINGKEYNLRLCFMPTFHGENAVIRILPTGATERVSFAKLGFTPDHGRAIYATLRRSNGLVLVTGPTGSGKTTTLHAFLSIKAEEPLSIITLEDPVEYEVPGIRQVHIDHSRGVNFATGLRSALRQDPDVIMVGEIRDQETAKIAIHTALTGHLVFSTLHTNSALEAIPRLIDMGVDRYLLASTLRLVIAQRLIRNLCSICLGEGCEKCRQSGYCGRSIIAEVLEVDSAMAKILEQDSAISVLAEEAGKKGFRPMREDGMEKVQWGVTTIAEVARVLSV